MLSSRRFAMLLLVVLGSGCSRSREAELQMARAEADAARAQAEMARVESERALAVAQAALAKAQNPPKNAPAAKSDELAKEYVYPEATKTDSAGGGTAPAYLVTFVTTDDRDKVLDWYGKKLINLDRPRIDGVTWAGEYGNISKHDTHQPVGAEGGDAKPRPALVSVLTKRTESHTVTAVISRADGEKHTHIVLTLIQDRSK